MALVSSYTCLRKQDANKAWRPFTDLRAIGLAVEQGHKQSKRKGLGTLTAEAFAEVGVSGPLQIYDGGRWRRAPSARLRLLPQDQNFTLELLHEQRAALTALGFNFFAVDMKAGGSTWDLVGDFGHDAYGVPGLVGVELKVFSDSGFEGKVARACDDLKSRSLTAVEGVLLLAARCARDGGGWARPQLTAKLYSESSGRWKTLGLASDSGRPARQGCSLKPKVRLQAVLGKMEWHTLPEVGGRAGLLKHFLEGLGLDALNPGKRAATFNRYLARDGRAERFVRARLPGGGKPAWVAPKTAYSVVHRSL